MMANVTANTKSSPAHGIQMVWIRLARKLRPNYLSPEFLSLKTKGSKPRSQSESCRRNRSIYRQPMSRKGQEGSCGSHLAARPALVDQSLRRPTSTSSMSYPKKRVQSCPPTPRCGRKTCFSEHVDIIYYDTLAHPVISLKVDRAKLNDWAYM